MRFISATRGRFWDREKAGYRYYSLQIIPFLISRKKVPITEVVSGGHSSM